MSIDIKPVFRYYFPRQTKERGANMKSFVPADYPRPQLVRKNYEILNGQWDFVFDDKNEGLASSWNKNFPAEKKIIVPFSYETPASGIGDEARHDVVWYRRSFNAKKSDKKTFVHFEGCDFITDVWINGEHSGRHVGGYARFSFEVSRFLKDGNNEIVVRAEDSFSVAQPRGKQRWKNENFGCWYVQTTGIWKTVWLEQVNDVFIESLKMTPVCGDGKIEISVNIAGGEHLSPEFFAELGIEAKITFAGKPVSCTAVAPNTKETVFCATVCARDVCEWGFFSWSPGHPALYDIVFSLKHKEAVIDEVFSYFGMRDVRTKDSQVLLNNTPLYQRLILDQGYWKDTHLTPPNDQALVKDIDSIMQAGYNGVRKHQKTEDARFLYWADVKGLLVWSEVPAAYAFCDEAVSNFTTEWMEIVKQNYNHPSVITWTPFNESWGVPGIKLDRKQQLFTESIYYLTKSYDAMRPVICNDGWEHTISDIITLHDYEEKGEDFLARYLDMLDEILDNEIPHNKGQFAFAEGYKYCGQPIILSEFGGIAFNEGSGWGYGNKVSNKEDYVKRFDDITTAIKKVDRICGYCYTQVTDVQQEINGIMDMQRNFKVDPALLKEINERKVGSIYR